MLIDEDGIVIQCITERCLNKPRSPAHFMSKKASFMCKPCLRGDVGWPKQKGGRKRAVHPQKSTIYQKLKDAEVKLSNTFKQILTELTDVQISDYNMNITLKFEGKVRKLILNKDENINFGNAGNQEENNEIQNIINSNVDESDNSAIVEEQPTQQEIVENYNYIGNIPEGDHFNIPQKIDGSILQNLTKWKLNNNVTDNAINQLLGKKILDYPIKAYKIIEEKKKWFNEVENYFKITNFSFIEKGQQIEGTFIDVEKLVFYLLETKYSFLKERKTIDILISGDGRKSSRKTDFTLMSLKFLYNNTHSPDDIYSIALVQAGESSIVIEKIMNKLNPKLEILANQNEKFRFHFCADLKFLAFALGIQRANSNYFCPWCTCTKEAKCLNNVNFYKFARHFDNMSGNCLHCDDPGKYGNCSNTTHGVNGKNLLSPKIFSMQRVWLDPLHITLRITDMIEKEFLKTIDSDEKNIILLTQEIKKQCNLIVKPYKEKNKKPDESAWKMPNLSGADKKIFFSRFRNFSSFMASNDEKIWQNIFSLTNDIITYVHGNDAPIITVDYYSLLIYQLKKILRVHLGDRCIIPYFHCCEVHVPEQIVRSPFFCIGHFTLSGQEGKHKFQTITQFRATNQKKCCKQILLHEYAIICK